MRVLLVLTVAVAGLILAACGSNSDTAPTALPTATQSSGPAATSTPEPTALQGTTPTPPGRHFGNFLGVDVTGAIAFSPSELTAEVGDSVQWTVTGSRHTTTSGQPGVPNGIWDSLEMRLSQSFTHVFEEVGEFPYYCRIHGSAMTGTITVVPRGGK